MISWARVAMMRAWHLYFNNLQQNVIAPALAAF